MQFDSDDEKEDPTKLRRAAAGMKSIFASDERTAQSGSQSLRYEGPRSRGGGDDFISQPMASPGAPPVPAAGQTMIACNGAVHAHKGDTPIGAAAILIASTQAAGTLCVIVDKEKRHLCRVRVNDSMQLLPNPQQRQYLTLYDPSFGGHWMLAFKDIGSCNAFVAGALTVQHFLLLPNGPRAPFVELAVAHEGPVIKKSDTVSLSLSVWLMQKKGNMTTAGKLVEEIVDEAPRRIVVGENSVMVGVEDALIGMGPGGRKLIFVPPKKTRQAGLGNPEIGATDAVIALVSVAAVEPYDPSLGLDDAQRSAAANAERARQRAAMLNEQQQQPAGGGGGAASRRRGVSFNDTVGGPRHDNPAPQQAVAAAAPAVVQQQQPVVAAAHSASADTNALITALLLKTLAEEKKAPAALAAAPVDQSSRGDGSAFMERSLTMLQQQLSALYEKLDRLDIDQKLEANNQKIERMVKKAVGKVPTLDVDVEDAGKDREALLARIEQLKEKAEQSKADYYAALETMGKHKDDVVALRNDVNIAVRTGEEKVQELKERHRLEIVDSEVRYRRELDRVSEQRYAEGKERGYAEGYGMGRVEGLTESGSASTEELREKLAKKESEVLEVQAALVELEARGYAERRAALEQQSTLQAMIDRLEARNANKEKSVVDAGAMNAKFLRRVMNSAYAAIETQFYATERDSIAVSEALNMVLIAIKSETRQAADELKKLAVINSKEIVPLAPLPFETEKTRQRYHDDDDNNEGTGRSSKGGAAAAAFIPPPPPPSSSSSSLSQLRSSAAGGLPPPPPPPPPLGMFNASGSLLPRGSSESQFDSIDAAGASPEETSVNRKDDDAGAAASGGGGDEEDAVMKMLREYRAQRDKELASESQDTAAASAAPAAAGGTSTAFMKPESEQQFDVPSAFDSTSDVNNNYSYGRGAGRMEVDDAAADHDSSSYQHQLRLQQQQQQQQQRSAQQEEEEEQTAPAAPVAAAYEEEDEEPVKPVKASKRSKPKAKVAQAEDDDWE